MALCTVLACRSALVVRTFAAITHQFHTSQFYDELDQIVPKFDQSRRKVTVGYTQGR